MRVNRQHGSGRIQNVGPIGRRRLDGGDADLSACAGFVVHHHYVGVRATQLLRDPAGKGIGRATGRKAHNDAQIFQASMRKIRQMGQTQHAGSSALHQLATGGHGSELLKS